MKLTAPKRYRCPRCGSATVMPIVYGYPTEQERAAAEHGDVCLGGSEPAAETAYCHRCAHRWIGDVSHGPYFQVHFAIAAGTPLPPVARWQTVRARDEAHAVMVAARQADLSWAAPGTQIWARVALDWDETGKPKQIVTLRWRVGPSAAEK